jgi:predicted ABC-type transport system involved in lysophospholipase L1 biosynthesis ATPase subunit
MNDRLPLVRCVGAARTYGQGPTATVALQRADCEVFAGERIGLVGPSGQLDSVNGAAVVDVLLAASAHAGSALLISTHDLNVASRLPERWEMHSGELEAHTREATWSH